MGQQVLQAIRFRAENDDSDAPARQILLVFPTPVHGHQNIEMGRLNGLQKIAVFQSRKTCIPHGLTIVLGEGTSQPLINAFVDENAHLGPCGGQEFSGLLQGSDRHFAGDCGKTLEKFFQRFAAFQIVEQSPDRNTSSSKYRRTVENFRVSDD